MAKRRKLLCWLFGCRWKVVPLIRFVYGDMLTVMGPKCGRCGRTENP